MRLLSTDLSPFASRVRAQIYEKSLPVRIERPDPPLRSEAFKAKFVLGQIPVLILEDGRAIAESWVILNYLEDLFPEPPLRPRDPLACAEMGLLQAAADHHIRPSLGPLFVALFTKKTPDNLTVLLDDLKLQFTKLDRLFAECLPGSRRQLHLGDLALAPTFQFAITVPAAFGMTDPLKDLPRVAAWWDWVRHQNSVAKVLGEIEQAQHSMAKS